MNNLHSIDTFSENKDFYNALLTKISTELLTRNSLPAKSLKEESKDFFKGYSTLLANNYKYVNKLIAAQKIGVEDIELLRPKQSYNFWIVHDFGIKRKLLLQKSISAR